MIVQCPKCNKKYIVDENEVPAGGAAVRCPNCGNIFTIYKEVSNITLLPFSDRSSVTEEIESPTPNTAEAAPVSDYGINKLGEIPNMEEPLGGQVEANVEETGHANEIASDFEELLKTSSPTEKAAEPETASSTVQEPITSSKPKSESASTISNDKISALWEKFKSLSGGETTEEQTESVPEEPITSSAENFEREVKTPTAENENATGILEPSDMKTITEEEDKEREKAKKLARALAKDIKLYHGDKVKQGLEQGNLVELIGSEIKKSWKFYQQKVSPQMLQNTTYFEDALNEIVANGQKLFKFK